MSIESNGDSECGRTSTRGDRMYTSDIHHSHSLLRFHHHAFKTEPRHQISSSTSLITWSQRVTIQPCESLAVVYEMTRVGHWQVFHKYRLRMRVGIAGSECLAVRTSTDEITSEVEHCLTVLRAESLSGRMHIKSCR